MECDKLSPSPKSTKRQACLFVKDKGSHALNTSRLPDTDSGQAGANRNRRPVGAGPEHE
jgi:hypothetical protein